MRNTVQPNHDRPAAWISNLLCFGYGICRPPLTGGEDGAPKSMPYVPDDTELNAEGTLAIYPNPVSGNVIFSYQLPTDVEVAELVVHDATGRVIFRVVVQDTQALQEWNTHHAVPGAYSVSLVDAARVLCTEKLIVLP